MSIERVNRYHKKIGFPLDLAFKAGMLFFCLGCGARKIVNTRRR